MPQTLPAPKELLDFWEGLLMILDGEIGNQNMERGELFDKLNGLAWESKYQYAWKGNHDYPTENGYLEKNIGGHLLCVSFSAPGDGGRTGWCVILELK